MKPSVLKPISELRLSKVRFLEVMSRLFFFMGAKYGWLQEELQGTCEHL
jgi:hypothetical protein